MATINPQTLNRNFFDDDVWESGHSDENSLKFKLGNHSDVQKTHPSHLSDDEDDLSEQELELEPELELEEEPKKVSYSRPSLLSVTIDEKILDGLCKQKITSQMDENEQERVRKNISNQLIYNGFKEKIQMVSLDTLRTWLLQMKIWILSTDRISTSDWKQYKLAVFKFGTLLDVSIPQKGLVSISKRQEYQTGILSISRLFKVWKERHPDQHPREYSGIPFCLVDLHKVDREALPEKKQDAFKRRIDKSAKMAEHGRQNAITQQFYRKPDLFLKTDVEDILPVNVKTSTYLEISQFLRGDSTEKQDEAIENILLHFVSSLDTESFNVNLILDSNSKPLISQGGINRIIERSFPDLANCESTDHLLHSVDQICKNYQDDDHGKISIMISDITEAFKNVLEKKIKNCLGQISRQGRELMKQEQYQQSVSIGRRIKCLGQSFGQLQRLVTHYYEISNPWESKYLSDIDFIRSDVWVLSPERLSLTLQKTFKFRDAEVKEYSRSKRGETRMRCAPTLCGTNGGIQTYQIELSKIWAKPNEIGTQIKESFDLAETMGVTYPCTKPWAHPYQRDGGGKQGGNVKVECDKCGKKIPIRSYSDFSMRQPHSCNPSKEWEAQKAQRKVQKDQEKARKLKMKSHDKRRVTNREEKKKGEAVNWRDRQMIGYRCMYGRDCQCGAPSHCSWKDNAMCNKIVIDEAEVGGYLPIELASNEKMMKILKSEDDSLRITNVQDRTLRHCLVRLYIEDLSLTTQERFQPLVGMVYRQIGADGSFFEHLDLMMSPNQYKANLHRWKEGSIRFVSKTDESEDDEIIVGFQSSLNDLWARTELEAQFKNGNGILGWIFNSFNRFQNYQRRQMEGNDSVPRTIKDTNGGKKTYKKNYVGVKKVEASS